MLGLRSYLYVHSIFDCIFTHNLLKNTLVQHNFLQLSDVLSITLLSKEMWRATEGKISAKYTFRYLISSLNSKEKHRKNNSMQFNLK